MPASQTSRGRRGPYRQSSARRDKILDAAVEVFAREGYNAGSIRKVAEVAEVSEGGLLHHFPTKAKLLSAVLEHRDARAEAAFGMAGASGRAVLDSLVALARHNQSAPGLARLHSTLSLESTDPDHPAHAYFAERNVVVHDLVENALSDLAQQGRLRPGTTPSDGAVIILAAMDGLQIQWLQNPGSVDMSQLLRLVIESLTTRG